MTRINLVPPRELMDQHLFAEFREIKMVPKSLARSLAARGLDGVLRIIPAEFTLGKGHVSFFYDKGQYLFERYEEIRRELRERNYAFAEFSEMDPDDVFFNRPQLLGRYEPTPAALALVRARIAERIALKPEWYRYSGRCYI